MPDSAGAIGLGFVTMPHRRSHSAALSPVEVTSLQRARDGYWQLLSNDHQALLLSMDLVAATESGQVVLTDHGPTESPTVATSAPNRAPSGASFDRMSR